MSVWTRLGFRDNPYRSDPIQPDTLGETIFVGRHRERQHLADRLTSSATHPTVEGDNGVGKTSLVAVVGFRLFEDFNQNRMQQAIIPVEPRFQLVKSQPAEDFEAEVFYHVARSFIKHGELLRKRGYVVPRRGVLKDANKLLSTAVVSNTGGGVSAVGVGANLTLSRVPNTTKAFAAVGFQSMVKQWLEDCFPDNQFGSFVCVIDNLELLETSKEAAGLLETLRDSLFNQRGLKWVLCGARGIVRSVVSSPRLEGRLSEPIQVAPITHDLVGQIVQKRIDAYRFLENATAPVSPEAFTYLYNVLNRNLRNALKYSEDFVFWLQDADEVGSRELLQAWLTSVADDHIRDTKLSKNAWRLLDSIADDGGTISPSDYAQWGFKSQQAMRTYARQLEETNLVQSVIQDGDKRRKLISLTPRGWLVRFGRNGYVPPQ